MDYNGILDNGVELYTCLNPRLSGFALSLWMRRGAMHEPAGSHGLAHMLEHVTFRSINERLGGRLYAELRRLGLCFDATTYTGYVRFDLSGPSEHLDAGMELLLMALDPPEVSLAGLDLERRRVQAEIREGRADDIASARVWQGTQLARTISGTKHSTNRIGFEALRAEHARWFGAGNYFFCATGNIPDPEGLARRLASIPVRPGVPVVECAPVPEQFFHRDAAVVFEESSSAWMKFCFDVDTTRHSEMAHMLLMDALLGDLGTLYDALSEDRALVYDLNDCFERYANIGSLSFEFEVETDHAFEAVDAVVGALNAVKAMGEEDFRSMQAGFVLNERMMLDEAVDFNSLWGYDNGLRHCGFKSAGDRLAAYMAVGVSELRDLAREVFVPQNLVYCVQGSRKRLREEKLRERLMKLGV